MRNKFFETIRPTPLPPQLGNRAIKKLRNKYFCAIITYSGMEKR